MIVSVISIKGMKVEKYTKDGILFRVFFDDGYYRSITKSIMLGSSEDAAQAICSELKGFERKAAKSLTKFDADSGGSAAIIRFENEAKAREKIMSFLEVVKGKVAELQQLKDASNYLEMVSKIQRLETYF